MPRYRRKPLIVEAEQFWWDAPAYPDGVEVFPGGFVPRGKAWSGFLMERHARVVCTDGEERWLYDGDWVLRDSQGILGTCSQDEFLRDYEPVDDEDAAP